MPTMTPTRPAMPTDLVLPSGVVGGISDLTELPPGSSDDMDESVTLTGYLRRILTSRVYDLAIETPLEKAPRLSARLGVNLLLKREDMQPVFSFKLRGAYNKMANMTPDQLARGVICSSAGNHAQGVAMSAAHLKCNAVIAMPVTTPSIKVDSVRRLGAKVVLVGDTYDACQAWAKSKAAEEGWTFIPPFDDPDVIAGQGTVGMEILRQHSAPIHAVFVPVGGGGLIAGIAAYIKALRPDIRVIGVEPSDANAMALSMLRGHRAELQQVGGFADGVAVRTVGVETFRLARQLVDGVIQVDVDEICAAVKFFFEEKRGILEPAGALSIAGAKAYAEKHALKAGETLVAVASGANMNFDRLRMVSQLADVGLKKEAMLVTTIKETPGAFKEFAGIVGYLTITEFKYRYMGPSDDAHIFYSVGLTNVADVGGLMSKLTEAGMPTVDVTQNSIAKMHLRHLAGGKPASKPRAERILRVEFPERPGALMRFLNAVSPRWNITLFHYRATGETIANILLGLEMGAGEMGELRAAVEGLSGYSFADESDNAALQLFL
eukprot:jgi/Mesvir1/22770/Mv14162-RA.1